MATEENRAIVQRFADMFNTGNFQVLDEIAAPGFAAHLTGSPGTLDVEGWKQFSTPFLVAFSDRQLTVEDIIAEGDEAVGRITFRGRHTGDFQGIPPTDREVTFTGAAMFRMEGGKIVEHWGQFDALGLMQQLGAIPASGQQ